MENMNPLDILKEELEADDISTRVNAIHKVSIVVTLMTP